MPDYGLSSQQLAVICALSCGANLTAAAEQAGVHRNTVANWRRNSLPFQQGFAHAQYDRALYYREKVEDLIDLAIKSLHDILTDPKARPTVKLKAALAIITTASTPPAPKKQVELDIEKIVVKRTPPETVTEDQFEPAPPMHNDAQPEPPANPPSMHNDAQPNPEICVHSRPFAANPPAANTSSPPETVTEDQPENPPSMHNDAQPNPEICMHSRPFAANPPARNAQCPCGSGKKYKRCCLNAPPLTHAA